MHSKCIPKTKLTPFIKIDMHTCWNKAMRRLSSNPESPKDLRFHDWCIRSWRFWQSSGTSWCANNPTRPRRRFALGRMFPPIPLGRPSQNQAVLVAPVVRDEPTDERFHFVPRCSFCLAVGKYGGDSKQQKYELSNNTIWPEVEKTTQAKNCCSELRKKSQGCRYKYEDRCV